MKYAKLLAFLCLFLMPCCIKANCNSNNKSKSSLDTNRKTYDQLLDQLEKQASEKNTDSLGILLDTVDFRVRTSDLTDYKDGFVPWINLDKPKKSMSKLIDKDEIIIHQSQVTIIIDYPLTHEYRFTLQSNTGFSRALLVNAISLAYYRIYEEEEKTSDVKTIPIDKRTTVYNRNQTNGKYGIWGHDIADLVLAYILVYKSPDGEILLSLNINS